jgi:hypothetical protein
MRAWIPAGLAVMAAVVAAPGCGNGPEEFAEDEYGAAGSNDEAELEEAEIVFLQWAKKGDAGRRVGAPGGMTSRDQSSQHLLLYTKGWMKERTFGGPFEAITKPAGVTPGWKEIKHTAYRDLKAFFWKHGFFDELPGTEFIEREPFEDPEYSTKALAFTIGNERKIVFLDSVTKGAGTDPRWDSFNTCVEHFINVFTKIEDVRARVEKQDPNAALRAFLNRK